MPRGVSRADANRKIRQESLREQLANQKHIEKVVDLIKEVENLKIEMDVLEIQRLRIAIEKRLKLVDKYLPDLKQVESTIDVNAWLSDASDTELDARISQLIAEAQEG